MSRSPKYSFAQLGDKVLGQLERDRDARRRRRETAEARVRDRVLAESRGEILGRSGAGPGDAVTGTGEPAVAAARRQVREAGSLPDLEAGAHELDRAEKIARRLRARAAVHAGAGPAGRIAVLTAMLAEAGPETRARFDSATAAEVDAALARLRAAGESTEADADELDRLVQRHLDRVAEARTRLAARRRKAAARVDLLAARIAGLHADARAANVPLHHGERIDEALAMVRVHLARGEYDEVLSLGAALERRVDLIESDLDAVTDRLAERRTILTSLVRALPKVGFAVDPSSLTESKDGAILLRASRPGGDTVGVMVKDEPGTGHRVLYASDAVQREADLGRGGTACGELLEVVDVLQDSAGHEGVVLGPVMWEGHDDPPQSRPVAVQRRRERQAEARHQQENPSW